MVARLTDEDLALVSSSERLLQGALAQLGKLRLTFERAEQAQLVKIKELETNYRAMLGAVAERRGFDTTKPLSYDPSTQEITDGL